MTDREIKKGLESCTGYRECSKCPYDSGAAGTTECIGECMSDALAMIVRLQAENERLKREIEDLESVQEISPEAKYLVDTKADKVISLLTEINKSQEQIKAEAYKESIEKLKEKTKGLIGQNFLDDFLKELVGDAE